MNPNLNNIKDSGYNIPEDYFNTLEDTLMDAIKLEQKISKDTGFSIPKGYLNTVEENVFSKVKQYSGSKALPFFKKQRFIYISGIAATLLIFLSIYMTKQNVTFDNIELDLVENYLSETEVLSEEMAILITDDIILEDEFLQENLSEEYIEDFILNETSIDNIYE